MSWLKVAGVAVGVLVAYFIVSAVMGFALEILIAAVVIGAIAVAVKAVAGRRRIERQAHHRAVWQGYSDFETPDDHRGTRGHGHRDYGQSPSRTRPAPPPQAGAVQPRSHQARPGQAAARDVEDELSRLKREMDR